MRTCVEKRMTLGAPGPGNHGTGNCEGRRKSVAPCGTVSREQRRHHDQHAVRFYEWR